MDSSSSAGPVDPALLSASVKSVVTTNLQANSFVGSSEPLSSISIGRPKLPGCRSLWPVLLKSLLLGGGVFLAHQRGTCAIHGASQAGGCILTNAGNGGDSGVDQ